MIAVVVLAFFALGCIAIQRFLNREWMIALLAASASLMCIPWVDQTSQARERLAVSLVMPFAMAGLACTVLLYFQMFSFAWFEAIFNDKGSGPIGLMVSAITGLAAGGCMGWRLLRQVGWL